MLGSTTYPPPPPDCHDPNVTCTTAPPPTPITGADTQAPMAVAGGLLVLGVVATAIARWRKNVR